jgi:hypothetical protein
MAQYVVFAVFGFIIVACSHVFVVRSKLSARTKQTVIAVLGVLSVLSVFLITISGGQH